MALLRYSYAMVIYMASKLILLDEHFCIWISSWHLCATAAAAATAIISYTLYNSQFSCFAPLTVHFIFPTKFSSKVLKPQGVSTQARKLLGTCYKMYMRFIKWDTIALFAHAHILSFLRVCVCVVVMYAFHAYSQTCMQFAVRWSLCAFDCSINWCHLLTQFSPLLHCVCSVKIC